VREREAEKRVYVVKGERGLTMVEVDMGKREI
jgi:hypothetical protein